MQCSKNAIYCVCNAINNLPTKAISWKCKNFECPAFIVHFNCGRVTFQDLKSPYPCLCGYEYEYDVEMEINTAETLLFHYFSYICFMLLKCASYNVNGLRKNPKRKSISYFLKEKNYDVKFLQETHSCFNDEKLWQYEWGGKLFFSHGENNSKGVAI